MSVAAEHVTPTTVPSTATAGMLARMLGVELADELRGILREPTAWFFSILMPVGFFALFGSLFGGADPRAGTMMLATYGTFGVLSVCLMNPGIGVAADRERGWLKAKLVSAVPVTITLAAKMLAALPYALGVLAAMTLTAWAVGFLTATPLELLKLGGALLLGALPFSLLGLAVGFQAKGSATAAILNAILLPSAIAAGLWFPLDIMPRFVQTLAPFLPTYHLGRLALSQVTGDPAGFHALALVAMTLVMAAVAAVSYRFARS